MYCTFWDVVRLEGAHLGSWKIAQSGVKQDVALGLSLRGCVALKRAERELGKKGG